MMTHMITRFDCYHSSELSDNVSDTNTEQRRCNVHEIPFQNKVSMELVCSNMLKSITLLMENPQKIATQ
jgi:hypothetical protein